MRTIFSATCFSLVMLALAPQGAAAPLAHKNLQTKPRVASTVKQQAWRGSALRARPQATKSTAHKLQPKKALPQKARPQKTHAQHRSAARSQIKAAAVMARLPKHEQATLAKLIRSQRVRSSIEARRAVAAYMVLRGLKDGNRLPLSAVEMEQMTSAKRWSAKRMGNFALVLREAVRIAQKEKISAKAAFNKALKKFGVYKKFYSGVCGA